jgi:hypothetical protein
LTVEITARVILEHLDIIDPMINPIVSKIKKEKLFKSEDSKFILATALKVSTAYLICAIFVVYAIWLLMSVNNTYFEANGFFKIEGMDSAFFDYVGSRLVKNFWYLLVFYILLFFAGIYLAKILLRPFKIIGDFCESAVEDTKAEYNPDAFSDYKLLTGFSEFFFDYLRGVRSNKKMVSNSIPPAFSKVRGPVFDRVFFFHFSLFVLMIAICTIVFISFITTEVYQSVIELAISTIPKSGKEVAYFLKNQEELYDSVQYMAIAILLSCYMSLSIHLYGKVSGAVFGFFSTMRSFMKGNSNARIHLVGYPHIRPYSRAFNKYLDQVCREIEPSDEETLKSNKV